MKNKGNRLPLVIGIGLAVFAGLIVLMNVLVIGSANKYVYAVAVNLLLGVSAVLFVLYAYEKKASNTLKVEKRKLKAEKNLIYRHYAPIEERLGEINKFCHDARNILNLLWDCSSQNQEAETLAVDFLNRGEALSRNKYCDNLFINTVLSQKAQEAEQHNIKTCFTVNLSSDLKISEIDVCTCLFNLLDNAISANATADVNAEKHINIDIKSAANFIIIEQENTFYIKLKKGLRTTKEGKNHGLGLKIISDTAKSHNGYAKSEVKGNIFYSTVCLEND
ncbi:MAG: GHKL domain-containing protein [Eubacteriales bacterium]|nr:GHKL domain-containing protein [Eubacteriales bacterium]